MHIRIAQITKIQTVKILIQAMLKEKNMLQSKARVKFKGTMTKLHVHKNLAQYITNI